MKQAYIHIIKNENFKLPCSFILSPLLPTVLYFSDHSFSNNTNYSTKFQITAIELKNINRKSMRSAILTFFRSAGRF